jgi:hypothetical protein
MQPRTRETGELIEALAALSLRLPKQRTEALRIRRIGFASARAKHKPKEAIAA